MLYPFGRNAKPPFDIDGFEGSADGLAIELPALRLSPTVQALVVLPQQCFGVSHFRHPVVDAEQDGLSEFIEEGSGVRLGFWEQPCGIREWRMTSEVQAYADDGR